MTAAGHAHEIEAVLGPCHIVRMLTLFAAGVYWEEINIPKQTKSPKKNKKSKKQTPTGGFVWGGWVSSRMGQVALSQKEFKGQGRGVLRFNRF